MLGLLLTHSLGTGSGWLVRDICSLLEALASSIQIVQARKTGETVKNYSLANRAHRQVAPRGVNILKSSFVEIYNSDENTHEGKLIAN